MRVATIAVSAVLALVGVVLTVETALLGGGLGLLVGPMFVVAGALRLYLLRSRHG